MSWFNVNIPDIVAGAKMMLPSSSCEVWPQRLYSVVPDTFESHARHIGTLLKSNTRQSSAPVTPNFKRVTPSQQKTVGHSVKVEERPDLESGSIKPPADVQSQTRVQTAQMQEPVMEPLEEEVFFDAVEVQPHMNEPIWQTAKNNDHAAFVEEMKKKPDVLNLRDESGKTPLDWMPESRRKTELYETVKHLLDQDVFVDAVATQPHGMNEPIWQAAREGKISDVFNALRERPQLLTLMDESGKTPLELMPASEGKNHMMALLLRTMNRSEWAEKDEIIQVLSQAMEKSKRS